MARRSTRPTRATVWYRGIPYALDLVRCRRALVERQIEGELASLEELAKRVGISRSTASRFFSGRPTSLTVTLKILDVLCLKFGDVATPVVDDAVEPARDNDDNDGAAGNGVPVQRPPGPRRPDAFVPVVPWQGTAAR